MINHSRQQTNYCVGLASQTHGSRKINYEDDEAFEKLRKEIEANQNNALSLCTEKVLLARQAHDLVRALLFYFWILKHALLFILLDLLVEVTLYVGHCCLSLWGFHILSLYAEGHKGTLVIVKKNRGKEKEALKF